MIATTVVPPHRRAKHRHTRCRSLDGSRAARFRSGALLPPGQAVRRGELTNPNVLLAEVIEQGKSALAKSLAYG
jgi:hypothetical protein